VEKNNFIKSASRTIYSILLKDQAKNVNLLLTHSLVVAIVLHF